MMTEYNMSAYEKWDTEALVACPGCARTFRPEALKIHKRVCKPGHVLKARL